MNIIEKRLFRRCSVSVAQIILSLGLIGLSVNVNSEEFRWQNSSNGGESCGEIKNHITGETYGEYNMGSCLAHMQAYPESEFGCSLEQHNVCRAFVLVKATPCPEGQFRGDDNGCKTPINSCSEASAGNPVKVLSGAKYQLETDFEGSGAFPLQFQRYNHSELGRWVSLPSIEFGRISSAYLQGYAYPLTFAYGAIYFDNSSVYIAPAVSATQYVVTDFRGVEYVFSKLGGVWRATSGELVNLVELTDGQGEVVGFEFQGLSEEKIQFGLDGQIQLHSTRNNLTHTYTYLNNGKDIVVHDDQLDLDMTIYSDAEGRVERILAPGSLEYRYAYNAQSRLQYVSFPDETPNASGTNPFGEDNPYREYHYENANASLLTGITDERGIPYATWTYDTAGRALSSEHVAPSGIDRTTFNYANINNASDPHVVVTNELNQDTTYHFTQINGRRKPLHVERASWAHADPSQNVTCEGAFQYTSYDANGYRDVTVDWEGKATRYHYDTDGREDTRWEGLSAIINTSQVPHTITDTADNEASRQIDTQWNNQFRLPKREILSRYDVGSGTYVAEKVTDYKYDCANGRLEAQQVYAFGDEPPAPDCPP